MTDDGKRSLFRSYRFTEWQSTPSLLYKWLYWFKIKGVPAAIVKNSWATKYNYAIFRHGVEHKNIDSERPDELFPEDGLEVVDSVNGFELKFRRL